jgi:glucosamine-6-phosphate deaminase
MGERLKKESGDLAFGEVGKPILKLTEEDYNNHGMAQLAVEQGPVYQINIDIFNQVQHTITGWPGGKPGADDSQRPERAAPARKRSIVFSPTRMMM